MAIAQLWVEAYRPSTVDQYVFTDDRQREQVQSWIKDSSFPNLLLSGQAGIGKTSMAKMIINECGINDFDLLQLNASRNNSVDDVRERITNFVQLMPFGDFKVVLLDEADFLSANAQAALRGVMEEHSNTARFILTANFPHKIIPALHSRCQGFHISSTDITEFTARIATILITENIEFDLDTLDNYVQATFPDLRKCINSVQQNSTTGSLLAPTSANNDVVEWKFEMVKLFKEGKIHEARRLLCGKARPEEMEDIYRWLYDHISIFGDSTAQDSAVLIIKQALVDHTICGDSEINLAACLIRLARL